MAFMIPTLLDLFAHIRQSAADRFDLSLDAALLLAAAGIENGETTTGELLAATGMDAVRAGRALSELEFFDYAYRDIHSLDRRKLDVFLTDEGEAASAAVQDLFQHDVLHTTAPIMRAMRQYHAVLQVAKKRGVNATDFQVLAQTARIAQSCENREHRAHDLPAQAPQRVTIGDIVAEGELPYSTVSTSLARLEKKHLIVREKPTSHKDDRRLRSVILQEPAYVLLRDLSKYADDIS